MDLHPLNLDLLLQENISWRWPQLPRLVLTTMHPSKGKVNRGACVWGYCDRNTAGRHVRNQGIAVVEDRIGGRGSNEVNVFSSLDNTAVNREAETVRTVVMSGSEDKNSDNTVTTDVSVGMSARKLQDRVTNVIATLRTDTVEMIKTINSKFQEE